MNMAKSAVQSVGFDDFVSTMNDLTALDLYNIGSQDFSHDLKAYKNLRSKPGFLLSILFEHSYSEFNF